MKNVKFVLGVVAISTFILYMSSCNKIDCTEPVEDENIKDDVSGYVELLNVFNLTDAMEISDDNKSEDFGCMTVTVEENANGEFWPRNWTLDYGDGCVGWHGNERKGKIHVTLTDYWLNDSSLRTITFEDYYFNDNQLQGTKTILNNGENENGNPSFTRQVTDGVYSNSDSTITWDCVRYSEMIEGSNTFWHHDDRWSVTGSSEGVDYDGDDFTVNITTALIYKHHCYFPISGVIEIASGDDLIIIDYGDGDCDSMAVVTTNGVSEEINLLD